SHLCAPPRSHYFFCLSLCSSPDLPLLHPFPTRRSSDLHPAGPGPVCGRAGRLVALVACIDVSLVGPGLLGVRPHAPPVGTGALRSEEHTSELQSRFDLVCRLLLEKKKIKKLLKRQYITA